MNRSRIIIADDHTLLAELCKSLLEPEFSVVLVVGDGRALIAAVADLKPDLVVVDIGMPVMNGLDAAKEIKRSMPTVKIVFLTMDNDPDVAAEGFRRGGSAFLQKTCVADELIIAVRHALRAQS